MIPMTIRTIAVVDDDDEVRAAMASLLRSFDFACRTFPSAERLLDALSGDGRASIDCICSDVQMPGMSGLDLAAIVAPLRAAPPIVLMTAFPNDNLVQAMRKMDLEPVLEKPVGATALVDAIERAIARQAGSETMIV